jgi:hypothetical protein
MKIYYILYYAIRQVMKRTGFGKNYNRVSLLSELKRNDYLPINFIIICLSESKTF